MSNQVLARLRQRQADILKALDEILRADREMLTLWKEANRR